jgi:hypothetical protein
MSTNQTENNERVLLDSVLYPMSLDYRKHWSNWEMVREIVQNSLDNTGSFNINKTGDKLVISDKGTGLELRHLLLGCSEKSESGNRGKFGEGLKLAVVVALRLGYHVEIETNNLFIASRVGEKFGNPVLILDIFQNTTTYNGFKISIFGYNGDTYQERFTLDKTPLFSYDGEAIFKEKTASLYVKGIYVKPLKDSIFSYDLRDVELEESRNNASDYEVSRMSGYLLSKCNVDSIIKTVLKRGVNINTFEGCLRGYNLSYRVTDQWSKNFKDVYGNNAVISTTTTLSREASYRGAKTVQFTEYITDWLKSSITTDKDYITAHIESTKNYTVLNLRGKQLKQQKRLQSYANKINSDCTVEIVMFTQDLNVNGLCDRQNKKILISANQLNSFPSALSTLIHELAHYEFDTLDATAEHVNACSRIGATLIVTNRRT